MSHALEHEGQQEHCHLINGFIIGHQLLALKAMTHQADVKELVAAKELQATAN